MKSILVTGANKGIGLAIVEQILREHPEYSVYLGARDPKRGEAARDSLLAIDADWSGRLGVLALDVASDASVERAAAEVARGAGDGAPLYGIVNNAGLATGALAEVLNVNVYGMHRVCEHFAPLVEKGGRIVNVTSAAGPNYVAQCSEEWQRFFLDPELTWEQLDRFMRDYQDLTPDQFAEKGLGSGRPYGISKACANACNQYLARKRPELIVNACTPGFIETDLTLELIKGTGKTPAEAGMKQPADGARVVLFLLFEELAGSGHYYGSDCRRSPLDRYRAPGSPEYTGD